MAGQALERVLEIEPSNKQAYEQGLELFARLNDWRSYAQAMDRYLPNLHTDEEKVVALRELARVQEQKLGARQVAFLQYCRALQLTPSNDEIREQVERLAEETGSYEELAAVYEEIAETVPRGPLAERLYLTLSKVQDTKLDDPSSAESSLRRILEFDPTNDQALERLGAMFARRGKNKEYVVSLEQKLEAAGSIERRKEILREIARVYDEQMNDVPEAENALMRALELEPDLETLSVLVTLQKRQGNHPAVASTLMRMRDIAPTPEDRARIQVEVAQVYERELQDDEGAVEGYRQALEFDPANPQALASLEQLYSKLDRPAELLAVYERQIELTSDYRERVKILFRSAAIWEERYQNLTNADACIEALGAEDRLRGVEHHLRLRAVTDLQLSLRAERHHRGDGVVPVLRGQDHRPALREHRARRVGGAQVDADHRPGAVAGLDVLQIDGRARERHWRRRLDGLGLLEDHGRGLTDGLHGPRARRRRHEGRRGDGDRLFQFDVEA